MGQPTGTSSETSATISVGINRKGSGIPTAGWSQGAGFTHYKWRLDDGAWSPETSIDSPRQEDPLSARRTFVIRNKTGLHARALTRLYDRIKSFESELWIEKDNERIIAKASGVGGNFSMLDLLTLALGCGSTIEAEASGPDAEKLLGAVAALIDDKFGESE